MAKTMKRHHKRAAKKDRKRTERKHKKSTRGYRKGSKSKTMKGKKDFTTKKSSKVFNRRRHYQKHAKGSRVVRKPYHMKRGGMADFKEAYKPSLHSGHSNKPVFKPRFHTHNMAVVWTGADGGEAQNIFALNYETKNGLLDAMNKALGFQDQNSPMKTFDVGSKQISVSPLVDTMPSQGVIVYNPGSWSARYKKGPTNWFESNQGVEDAYGGFEALMKDDPTLAKKVATYANNYMNKIKSGPNSGARYYQSNVAEWLSQLTGSAPPTAT